MKTKISLLLALITLSVITHTRTHSIAQQGQIADREEAKKRGTIAWFVQRAKAKGEKQVNVAPPIPLYAAAANLDDALSHFTAVIAQPVEKKSFIRDSATLITWHKLKVLEFLSQPTNQDCPTCIPQLNPPENMLPIGDDEILVPITGGAVTVDGVEVVSENKEFGKAFLKSRTYLLLLTLDASRRVGMITLGSGGIFTINSTGQIEPITASEGEYPIKRDLELQFNNSLELLKKHLRERHTASR